MNTSVSLCLAAKRQRGRRVWRAGTVLACALWCALASAARPGGAAEAPGAIAGKEPLATAGAASAEAAVQGRSLFERNCAHCHGEDARGDEGPSLYDLTRSDARIRRIIQQGIKGEMPKFSAKFNDAEIQALIAYLRTLKT